MADDITGPIRGADGPPPVFPQGGRNQQEPPRRHIVRGQISAVHTRPAQRISNHQLDVTIGAESYTELVIRVPLGQYHGWEGRTVIINFEE